MAMVSPTLSSSTSSQKKGDLSPGTPCSQCLRESNTHGNGSAKMNMSPSGQNGGQEFFGSSEECCSSWSGCCNSSCAGSCGDQQPLQQKLQDTQHAQQPLSAAMVVMQVSVRLRKVVKRNLCNSNLIKHMYTQKL